MEDIKTHLEPPSPTPAEPARSKMPEPDRALNSIREEIAQGPTNSVSEPQRLMNLYLTGKLSMGELAIKLRAHNSVVADTIIKDSKRSAVTQIDTREVPQASMSNPGSDLNPDAAKNQRASTAQEAKDQSNGTDDPEKRRQAEKKEENLKNQEAVKTVIQVTLFEKENREVKTSHHWRELHRKEKEREDQEAMEVPETPTETIVPSRIRKSGIGVRLKSTLEQLRERLDALLQGGAKGV